MDTTSRTRRWRRRATVMVAAGALAAGSLLSSAHAGTYTSPTGAVAEAPDSAVIDTGFALTGTGWTRAGGTQGSIIAVKLDLGAVQHVASGVQKHPETGANLAADVWAVIPVAANGTFSTTIPLPTASTATSAPRPVGEEYTVNLLTGSLAAGDLIRSVQFKVKVAAASEPTPDPTTTTEPTPDPTTTTEPTPDPTTTSEPTPDPTTTTEPTTEPTAGSSKADIDVSVDIPVTGGLAVSVAANKLDLGQAKLSSDLSSLDASGVLPAVTVADTRSSNPGWSLTAASSAFTGQEGLSLDGKYLGIGKTRVVSAAAGQSLTLGAGAAPGTGFTGGTTLASAAAGAGTGATTVEADLQLKAPANTTPGDYVSVVTITVS